MHDKEIKDHVHDYWNKASCGTEHTQQEKYTKAYFEEIEAFRYSIEPEIFSFAQFTRFRDKNILEVGVGAGTDFIQWVRAGAHAHGIDLTQEAITNVKHRLEIYGLQAKELQVADAELLPYPDNFFDCVYSWGVIHHSPDTVTCLQEIIRVTKPGGNIKVMIYNRHSLFAVYRWALAGLLKGRPFRSLSHVLFHDQESLGTKAYTFKEIRKMVSTEPISVVKIQAPATQHDLLYYKSRWIQKIAYWLASIWGWNRCGWFMMIELNKK